MKVYAKQWKDRTMVTGRMDAFELNEKIILLSSKIKEAINVMIKNGEEFTFDKLRESLSPKKKEEGSFLDFMKERIPERPLGEGTRKHHYSTLAKLTEFGKIKLFSDLTRKNIVLFNEFLRKQGLMQSTVHGIHKRVKVYVKEAKDFNLIETNPYDGYHVATGVSMARKYLTQEEVRKVAEAPIADESLFKVRDCFLFCSFTGLSYSDLAKLSKDGISEENGRMVIHGFRQKTGVNYNITLLSPAVKILEKYDRRLPVMTNQQYNARLKVVALYAGLKKKLTSHVARHTFATWALSSGVPLPVVSKMLGHAKVATTEIYAKVLQKDVSEGFETLEGKIG